MPCCILVTFSLMVGFLLKACGLHSRVLWAFDSSDGYDSPNQISNTQAFLPVISRGVDQPGSSALRAAHPACCTSFYLYSKPQVSSREGQVLSSHPEPHPHLNPSVNVTRTVPGTCVRAQSQLLPYVNGPPGTGAVSRS
ncbi:Hypothetical predicted protein [Marmota monax]|uniref:Secreted protein n=1 Tax=Marmota monax TaxID=9995 RepID=A0A5E4C8L4_MARMO|nr:Hypothetical predicted protein [Marmota monax]